MHPVLARQFAVAHERLSPEAAAYYAAGAGAGESAAEAAGAWSHYRLRPRSLRDVSLASIATTVLGTPLATPVGVAPTAFHHLAHPDAELASAAGTRTAGGLFVLSSRSGRRIEDVAQTAGPWWMQIYVWHDRAATESIARRAAAAGARALVLTVDTPVVGAKYASAAPPVTDADFLVNTPDADPDELDQDPSVGLDAIEWLRAVSGLPVVVKGVLRGDEARRCVDAGAAAVVVSNHGGRQLDRAVATADALPEVVAAVGADVEVYVDGGIRSGLDALTALALGARAVFLGRPVLWGLAADGADGVTATVGAVSTELLHTLMVAGFTSPAELTAAAAGGEPVAVRA